MKIFNRNNNADDIKEILDHSRDTSKMVQDIIENHKDIEKELYSLKEQHKHVLQLSAEITNLKQELKNVKKQLEDNYGEMVELTQTTTDTNKTLVSQIDKIVGNEEPSPEEVEEPSRYNRDIYILKEYGVIVNKRGETRFKACDLLYIAQTIDSTNPLYTPAYIGKKLGLSTALIHSLSSEIKKGEWDPLFDELFEKVEEHNKHIQMKFHFVEIADSYKKPYLNPTLKETEIYTPKYLCSIFTLLKIKEDIPKMDTTNLRQYYEKYELKNHIFRRIVWNLEEGYFDGVIEEYQSLKYSFEVKNNFLYIDGCYTGLTVEKCKIMVSEMCSLTNNPDDVINSYIRLYSTLNSKYIRIVCDSYDNVHLNRVLHPSKQKSFPSNTQKRREMQKSIGGGI